MSHTAIDGRFADLINLNTPVNRLGTGFVFTEGPIWHPTERHLLFSDMPGDVRRRWTSDGTVQEVMRPSNKGNGMTYDADLNLLVCEHSTSSVVRFRPDGGREVLCSHFEGKELNSPNDICVRSDGRIYFTDPTYGRREHFGVPRPLQQGFQGVYMLKPRHRPGDEPTLVSDRYMFRQPNGLCFSPCERWMWVNDTEQANIRMFDVAEDGRLINGKVFASGIKDSNRPGVPDGMKADVDGNIYVTAPGGVWVYSFQGIKLGEIEVPEMVANLHWGEDDWHTLFMCACTSLYSVRLKTRGRNEPFMQSRPTVSPSVATPAPLPPAADPSASPDSTIRIDPSRTVLILQDLQNDVMMEGGAFASTGAPDHARAQNVVENAKSLAEACRRVGITVIHVWMVCEPGHPRLAQHAPLFQGLKGENALVRGTWGAQPVPGLEPKPGDLVVEKMSMSAWETSRLESYLRHGGTDTIINCGAWTNMSVEHTARTAADKGYRVIVPQDACSTMNAQWHTASVDYALGNVATITSVRHVIAALV
ncbi:isochorismatase family protein [Thalassobaculum sp.]|uniref:isochorismatase family protein n=1 Tax=Thalassobaculum sp. TaxID=2022740 RepID=UPI0032EB5604